MVTKEDVDVVDALGGKFADAGAKLCRELDIKGGVQVVGIKADGILARARVKQGFVDHSHQRPPGLFARRHAADDGEGPFDRRRLSQRPFGKLHAGGVNRSPGGFMDCSIIRIVRKNMRQLKITKSITNRESASLDKYLQEIGKEELITVEEEVELAQRIKRRPGSA